ncbi:hypothetical protein J6J34_10300 [Pseudidiomarina sp. 1ASP75-14]|uniref:hypothetical protein n=1 Tax=Pseudidiomarina terrestris TaxID=2820060 RepID=UPI00264A93AA|nr:hypothetical protein [Pseudidiomarina sp. 1ASP75-14]MDN7138602.1 hypothetical protein [Pseudidiomarina sp. 1ASP75-14]
MRKLFWKIFPPYEVRLTIQEAKSFLDQFADLSKSILDTEVTSIAKDVEKTIYSVRIDGMKPDELALLLITNVIGQHLGCGKYHIYRGVLNMTGQDMLKVWHAAQRTMLERKFVSKSEVEKDNHWIMEQVKGAG